MNKFYIFVFITLFFPSSQLLSVTFPDKLSWKDSVTFRNEATVHHSESGAEKTEFKLKKIFFGKILKTKNGFLSQIESDRLVFWKGTGDSRYRSLKLMGIADPGLSLKFFVDGRVDSFHMFSLYRKKVEERIQSSSDDEFGKSKGELVKHIQSENYERRLLEICKEDWEFVIGFWMGKSIEVGKWYLFQRGQKVKEYIQYRLKSESPNLFVFEVFKKKQLPFVAHFGGEGSENTHYVVHIQPKTFYPLEVSTLIQKTYPKKEFQDEYKQVFSYQY